MANYTNPSLMLPELRSSDPECAISELTAALSGSGKVPDAPAFRRSVLQHERLSSTATSPGLALPHARMQNLPALSFALGRFAAPVTWFGNCAERVRLVFLFAIPETHAAAYLDLISGLARLSQSQSLLQRLLTAPDSHSMLTVLQEVQLHSSTPMPPART